jgi:ABC-2 type transport system ATP-binding protein
MPTEFAIEADGLTKSYGDTPVLRELDLSVARGSVFALLGPNGAGKTTTVRILSTLLDPEAGSARVSGHDVVAERRAVRRRISLTGQYAALDELQTGRENIEMIGRLLGLRRPEARARAQELLARFELLDAAGRRVSTYSGGMRRRLDLACSLISDPQVIFLDEPTTGLDPRSRQSVWDLVTRLAAASVTVFLTTQYLEEADVLADRIAVLDDGRIVAQGTADELKRQVAGERLELRMTDARRFEQAAARLGSRALSADPERLSIAAAVDGGASEVRALLDELDPERIAVADFQVRRASLDDVFMTLTGHHAASTPAPTPTESEPTHA